MELDFPNIFFALLSILILFFIVLFSFAKRSATGVSQFGNMTALMMIFAISSLIELLSPTLSMKLFFRNIAQIGNFFAPIYSVYFALIFTDTLKKKKIIIASLSVVPVIGLFLIFTDQTHHIVRSAVTLVQSDNGATLVVQSSPIGKLFVSYNFLLILLSIVILLTAKVSRQVRKQTVIISLGMVIITILLWLKMAGVISGIDMSVLYVPGTLVIVFGLFKYRLLSISPVAKDKVFEVIGEGIVVSSLNGDLIDINPAAITFFTAVSAALTNNNDPDYITEAGDSQLSRISTLIKRNFTRWDRALVSETVSMLDLTLDHTAEKRYYAVTVYPLNDSDSRKIGAVSMIRDVTRETEEKQALTNRANCDGLSGLYNQTYFKNVLRSFSQEAANSEGYFSILMMDIDFFKKINDTYGHLVGDEIIFRIAEELMQFFKGNDILCRYGGEEFALLLPKTDLTEAVTVAEKFRKRLEAVEFNSGDSSFHVTVSIGVARFPAPGIGKDEDDIIHAVDRALYRSKRLGRNMVSMFHENATEQ